MKLILQPVGLLVTTRIDVVLEYDNGKREFIGYVIVADRKEVSIDINHLLKLT